MLAACKQPTDPPRHTPNSPDTTSHEFTWQVFEFGDCCGYFRDVVVQSTQSVWAGGSFYMRDTISGEYQRRNAVHWTPSSVSEHAINFRISYQNDVIETSSVEISSVLGFQDEEIWFFANPGAVTNLKGTVFMMITIPYPDGPSNVIDAWGITPSNVYVVTGLGDLIRAKDGFWRTSVQPYSISRIHGIANVVGTDMIVLGIGAADSSSTNRHLLSIGPNETVEMLQSTIPDTYRDLWFEDTSEIWLAGSNVGLLQSGTVKIVYDELPNRSTAINGGSSNVFCVGSSAFVAHYNGSTWKRLETGVQPDSHFSAVACIGTTVAIVGQRGSKALLVVGTQGQ